MQMQEALCNEIMCPPCLEAFVDPMLLSCQGRLIFHLKPSLRCIFALTAFASSSSNLTTPKFVNCEVKAMIVFVIIVSICVLE